MTTCLVVTDVFTYTAIVLVTTAKWSYWQGEYGTKGVVVKRSDCILVYGSTTKGNVVRRSDCILVYGSTTKGVVKRSNCTLVCGSIIKGGVVKRSDCLLVYGSTSFQG